MNKRYIDFVPVNGRRVATSATMRKLVKQKSAVRKPVVRKSLEKPVKSSVIERVEPVTTFSRNASSEVSHKVADRRAVQEIPLEEIFVERVESEGASGEPKDAIFGVIEDYHPKFVQAEVKKRPLGSKSAVKPAMKSVTKSTVRVAPAVGVAASGAKVTAKAAPAGARTNFINVGRVEKRPLSKNVYARKAPVTEVPKEKAKEESKKPVVIIAKPEKDSKVGLVVAVILTIILGAAAGTVAFLLLPK